MPALKNDLIIETPHNLDINEQCKTIIQVYQTPNVNVFVHLHLYLSVRSTVLYPYVLFIGDFSCLVSLDPQLLL